MAQLYPDEFVGKQNGDLVYGKSPLVSLLGLLATGERGGRDATVEFLPGDLVWAANRDQVGRATGCNKC